MSNFGNKVLECKTDVPILHIFRYPLELISKKKVLSQNIQKQIKICLVEGRYGENVKIA